MARKSLHLIIMSHFLTILQNIIKNPKKYKIWSPTRFLYEKYFNQSNRPFKL
jgi:hypothetical protein